MAATVLVALGLWAVLAMVFLHGQPRPALAGSTSGLQLTLGGDVKSSKAGAETAHCFVDGKSQGDATLADCARRNGATGPTMDVGLDQPTAVSGAPAATMRDAGANMAQAPLTQTAATAECLRYSEQGWRGYGSALPLGACVRVLYQGQCARPGEAVYGRWGVQTLRLIPGRVEISDDNKRFRPLVEQNPADCSISAM